MVFNQQKNMIVHMLFAELMLFSLGYLAIIISIFLGSPVGQILSLFIMTIAVAEATIGLGILIKTFKLNKKVEFSNFAKLGG
jgi:NADH-quinone oxidoreductase subunit K